MVSATARTYSHTECEQQSTHMRSHGQAQVSTTQRRQLFDVTLDNDAVKWTQYSDNEVYE